MKDKGLKIVVMVVVALVLIFMSFATGFAVSRCSYSREISSYEWALKTIKENYYFDEPDFSYTQTAISAIAEKYLDRYSEYYTAEEYAEITKSNEGSKSGIGISYSYIAGKGIYIARVVGNSPAYLSGLRAGEWLKSGGTQAGGIVEFNKPDAFYNFIAPLGDGEKIQLNATDGTVYTMAKAEYTASYASFSTADTGWVFADAAKGGLALYEQKSLCIPTLPQGCAYIRLDQFFGTATGEFFSLVEKFNSYNCTSLILDLRSNGGGYVSVMQRIAGAFADGKSEIAMIARDKKGAEERYGCEAVTKAERRIAKNVKVFVLANAGTASASEALIGAMVCYGAVEYKNIFISDYSNDYISAMYPQGSEIKNGRTYGKGIMQTPFTNPATGEVLKLTTAKIFWPDKVTSIHDVGLTESDGCTLIDAAWEHTKGDDELQSAIKIIEGRLNASSV